MTSRGRTWSIGRWRPARHVASAAAAVSAALADTRVVVVTGARQCGKSTLVGLVARRGDAGWRDLDSAVQRRAASDDPTGFVEASTLMVIDEIQRVPELLLSIKEQDIRTSMSPTHEGRKCSFCGKKAGPSLTMARVDSGAVAICAECVDLCHRIMAEENAEPAAT